MKIVLFETSKVEHLAPITLTRPCYEILCAGTTLLDAAKLILKPKSISSIVRPHLKKIAQEKITLSKKPSDIYLFLNASVVPDISLLHKLQKSIASKKSFVIKNKKEIVAAYFSCKELGMKPSAVSKLKYGEVEGFLNELKLKNEKIPSEQFTYL